MPYSHTTTELSFAALSAAYVQDEAEVVRDLVQTAALSDQNRNEIAETAAQFVDALRHPNNHPSTVDAFLQEFSLSSQEGILLMRLAESLIRTPDTETATLLLRDKLAAGAWSDHLNAKPVLVKLGAAGLALCKSWILTTGGVDARHLLARLGDRVMLMAVRRAIGILGRHFVLGTSIDDALRRARNGDAASTTYSFDMLGEAALTDADAERYFAAYKTALLRMAATTRDEDLHDASSLSVKLSALHPRYEYANRDRCVPVLVERLLELAAIAKEANLGLTIDAEEADRLETSFLVFEQLLASPVTQDWDGLGLAIQAYQRRALPAIDWIMQATERAQRKITVRLVKGAYWDSEIKRAQEMGLEDYPVFTRKAHSDVSYLAAARKLLSRPDLIYAQFATHNAHTAAAIIHMAGDRTDLEFQRLHGMSDELHRILHDTYGVRVRTYAPVGRHKELLPYLVRRLLENGANNSFVNQLLDAETPIADLIRDPFIEVEQYGGAPHPQIHKPRDHFEGRRLAASGLDLTQSQTVEMVEALELPAELSWTPSSIAELGAALAAAETSDWSTRSAHERAQVLRNAATLLENEKARFMSLCVAEAKKTWRDADAEVREAVDFLLYYANQAEREDIAALQPLGTVACISPWNFPLAIFLGQVSAALAVGNTVIAKPAEQTPVIASEAVDLLCRAGMPSDALHLILGGGDLGATLIESEQIQGVCFTGSTQTAKAIARSLAETERGDIPLIAETGGINAMLVDSTALLEQAVQDVVDSAFQSAGQRCSACRIVCVQSDIADAFIDMLSGALDALRIGDPAKIETDVGPVIDAASQDRILKHVNAFRAQHKTVAEVKPTPSSADTFVPPIAFELARVSDLKEEVFGPVLHIVRFDPEQFDQVIDEINALGFGLTIGLHSRIDARLRHVTERAKVGNLYVNRNQIGAVVGVQPFGGQGLSGTGPKAGGPNYLARLCQPASSESTLRPVSETELPGPTGEDNRLSYVPRGRLLCLGGDEPGVLQAQIQRVEATGNQAVTLEQVSIKTLIAAEHIDGMVADGAMRTLAAIALAARSGAILPLLSVKDAAERFYVEKTVTVNTTAAGGNATLLAQI
ncbi:MAG: L-glutamate gamma-semialdehyde dehydrogenase [Pseudomonadota bacterium]